MRNSLRAFFFCLLILSPTGRGADPVIPPLTRPLMDEVGLVRSSDEQEIDSLLRKLHETGKIQMAVYITPSLGDLPIESFSLRVVETWKLGKKGQDQGLLFLIAPNERKMRLEVGYGLEGDLTDAFTKRVLDDIVAPSFRQKAYGDGIRGAIIAVANQLKLEGWQNLSPPRPTRVRRGLPQGLIGLLPPLLVIFIVLQALFGRRRRRGFWGGGGGGWGSGGGFGGGGGGFGGGGFSGGGGGFGGGGSSSSW